MKFIVTLMAVATLAVADVSHVVNHNYGPPANFNQHFGQSYHAQQQQRTITPPPHNYNNQKSSYSIQRSVESIVPSVPIASFTVPHGQAQNFLGTEHQQRASFVPALGPVHQTHSRPAQQTFKQQPYQHHQAQELRYNQQASQAQVHGSNLQKSSVGAPQNIQNNYLASLQLQHGQNNLQPQQSQHIQQTVSVPQQHNLHAFSTQPQVTQAHSAHQHQVKQNLFTPQQIQQIQQTHTAPQHVQQSYLAPQQVQQSYSAPQQVQQSYLAPQKSQETTYSAPKVQQSYSAPLKTQQTTYSAPQQVQKSYSAPQKEQQATYLTPQKEQKTDLVSQQVLKSDLVSQPIVQKTYSAPLKVQNTTYLAPVEMKQAYTAPQKKKKTHSAPKKVLKTDLAQASEQKVSLEPLLKDVPSNSPQMLQDMPAYLPPQEIQQGEQTQQMQEILSAQVDEQKVDIEVQSEAQNVYLAALKLDKSNSASKLELQQSNSAPDKMELADSAHASEQTESEMPLQEPIQVEESKSLPLQKDQQSYVPPQQIQQTSAPLPQAYKAPAARAQTLQASHAVNAQQAFPAQTQNLHPDGYSYVQSAEASNFIQPQQQFYSAPIQQFVPAFASGAPINQQPYSFRASLPLSYTNQQAFSGQQLNGFNYAAPLQQIYSTLPQYEQTFSSPIQQTFAIPQTSQNALNYFPQAPVQQTYSLSAQSLHPASTQIQQNYDLPLQQASILQNHAESSVSAERESSIDSAPAAEDSSISLRTEIVEDSNQNVEKKI